MSLEKLQGSFYCGELGCCDAHLFISCTIWLGWEQLTTLQAVSSLAEVDVQTRTVQGGLGRLFPA